MSAAGLRLGERDELLEVLRRHLRVDHQHELRIVERRHRHEVAHQRIRLVREQRLVRGERVGDGEQRVAVRRRLRDHVGTDHRGRSRPVLDHHRLLELLGERLGELAAEHVAGAAGAERRNDLDRAGRVLLGGRGRGESRDSDEGKIELRQSRHSQALRGYFWHRSNILAWTSVKVKPRPVSLPEARAASIRHDPSGIRPPSARAHPHPLDNLCLSHPSSTGEGVLFHQLPPN